MPASNSDGLLANRAFLAAVDAARAQAAQKAEAGGGLQLWDLGHLERAVATGSSNSLAGRRQAASSALFEPAVHGEALRG